MTTVTFLMFVVVWVVVGLLSGEGVSQDVLTREYQSHTNTEGRPSTHPPKPVKEPQKPDLLEPTDLPLVNASNTSFSHAPPHSRPYKLEEVLNTSMQNKTSSYFSQAPPTSGLQNTYNGSEFQAPFSSSSGTQKVHHYGTDSNTTASYVSSTSHAPSMLDRVASRNRYAPRNYETVNFPLYTLPNWERPPRFLLTQGNYSRVYRLPSWESSLSLFGVQSSGQVRLALMHADTDEAPVNITLFGPEEESEIRFNLSRSGHVLVSPHKLRLTLNKYTWFTVFRKDHVVCVFLAGKPDPFLVYEDVNSNLQFLHYTRFQVWSERQAHWDFVGKKYKNENKSIGLSEKALMEELVGIKEGLAERFALITNLVSFLQRPDIVGNLTLPDIQEVRDIGETVVPLRSILYFYAMIDNNKKHWTAM